MKRLTLLAAALLLLAPAALAETASAAAAAVPLELAAPAAGCAPATAVPIEAAPEAEVLFLQTSENASCTGQCRSQFGQCQRICQRFPCLIACETVLEICLDNCNATPA